MDLEIERCLRHPLYMVYYIDDLGVYTGMSPEQVEVFKEECGEDVYRRIVSALEWVVMNSDVDLAGLLPNLPATNERLHEFLQKVLRSIKDARGF